MAQTVQNHLHVVTMYGTRAAGSRVDLPKLCNSVINVLLRYRTLILDLNTAVFGVFLPLLFKIVVLLIGTSLLRTLVHYYKM